MSVRMLTTITTSEEKKRIPMIVGVSRARMDWSASVPSPGQLNTVSTTTAPEMTAENCRPATVTTGPSAFLSACLYSTICSGTPLARAVRT